jgi:hypothetical protein
MFNLANYIPNRVGRVEVLVVTIGMGKGMPGRPGTGNRAFPLIRNKRPIVEIRRFRAVKTYRRRTIFLVKTRSPAFSLQR